MTLIEWIGRKKELVLDALLQKRNHRKILRFFCLISMALTCHAFGCTPNGTTGSFTCYYISYTNGNDSNNGTAEATPWKRAPFMQTVTGTAAAHTPAYGDAYIFEGGDDWPNAVFGAQIVLTSSSTSTSTVGCNGAGCVYIGGGDTTWYISANCSGKGYSGYCRPVFDGGGSPVSTFPGGLSVTFLDLYGGGDNSGSGGYMIVDNTEFTGLNQANNTGTPAYIAKRCGAHCEIRNSYFHGWSHGGTATNDNTRFISGVANCPQDTTSSFHDNVFDGSDTTEDMGMVLAGGFNYFYDNYIVHVHNGVLGATQYFYHNTLRHINGSFDATSHGNAFEVTVGCEILVWNNWTDDVTGGATYFPGPAQSSGTTYFVNNLDTNDQNAAVQIASNLCGASCSGTAVTMLNNTLQEKTGVNFAPINGPGDAGGLFLPTLNVINDHLITDGGTYINWGRTTTQTATTNTNMSNSTASADGYNQSSTYWYYPPSGSGVTVGAGTNETSICTGITDPNLATPKEDCESDTTYGVGYNATTHTVIAPGRTSTARPASGAWDTGVYEFSGGTASAPTFSPTAPYTGSAVSVTISSSAFAVLCYTTNGSTPATNGGSGCTTGTLYSSPVSISSTTTLKAIAGGTGYTDSSVTTGTYTITAPTGAAFGSSIAVGSGIAIH